MRKILIGLLGLFRKFSLLMLKLRGKTEADVAAQRIVSGQSWNDFCDTLKAAGASLTFPGAPTDAFSQAEGYRYLTRLARAGLENFVEFSDPRTPTLRRPVHETIKMGADNPDNYYQSAIISGEYEYRITGKRNTIHYLSFGTQMGHYGQSGGMQLSGFLEGSDIEMEEDGTFTIMASCKPYDKNWLPMKPETTILNVRQTFLDRNIEIPADLAIERIGAKDELNNVTPKMIDEGLKSASTLVAGASLLFSKWARDFKQNTNQLPLFDPQVSTNAGGDPNIMYYHSYWALAKDEALVIEVMPPECDHWNFQLNNYWMESLDYRHYTIHVNKHTAIYEHDGSVRIIVAHEDPGFPNWINTVGHDNGTMCFRWIRAKDHPQPQTRVVKLSQLRRK